MNVGNDIVGETPRHQEQGSPDECAVAREHPQSKGGCHSISLNAGNGIVGETFRHRESDSPDVRAVVDKSPGNAFQFSYSAPDVGNDISSRLEYAKADKS